LYQFRPPSARKKAGAVYRPNSPWFLLPLSGIAQLWIVPSFPEKTSCHSDGSMLTSVAMNPNGTVSEILSHKGTTVWSISPNATVFEAIALMAGKNVGALLVTENDQLVGIISERDYTRKVILKGKSSRETAVKEILSGHVIHVSPSQTVEECLRLMTDHHIRHLPVLEGNKIVGIISIGDLVNWIISAQHNTISQLQTYITGYPG
jgi:CBS domain-containing protein